MRKYFVQSHIVMTYITYTFILSLFSSSLLAVPFTVTVLNGAGSGVYEQDTTINIFADPYDSAADERSYREAPDPETATRTFDQWVGDIQYVDNIYAQDTTITLSGADVLVTATYKGTRKWLQSSVISDFPPAHRGVIFFFHGKGGCANCLFVLAESRRIIDDALARGFGVVAIDSLERGADAHWAGTGWSAPPDPANNVDMQRVVKVRQQLIADGQMSPLDPIYMIGMSNGGIFASQFNETTQAALDFPVSAMVMMVSPGSLAAIPETTVPTMFILAENDTAPEGTGSLNPTALNHYANLLSRGIPTQLYISKEAPLHEDRLWRIEGLNRADSQTIYQSFLANGVIDVNGYQSANPTDELWLPSLPAKYLKQEYDVGNQLKTAYAEHAFVNVFDDALFAFLENPTTVIELVPVINSFSPSSGEPYTVVTLQGDNFFDIQSVDINGVNAEVVSSTSSTLWVRVPDLATTGPINVTNSVGTVSSSGFFTVIHKTPVIDSFSPAHGVEGIVVSIQGRDLKDVTQVSFSGLNAEILMVTPATIWCRVPAGAVTGSIILSNAWGSETSATDFEVLLSPVIDSFYPAYGPIGTEVTILGSNFSYLQSVELGTDAAVYQVVSKNEIRMTVPDTVQPYGIIKVFTDGGYAISPTVFVVR